MKATLTALLAIAAAAFVQRHELRDRWLDLTRDMHGWQLAMVRDEVFLVLLLAALVYCVGGLVWHWLVFERPADKRRKAQP